MSAKKGTGTAVPRYKPWDGPVLFAHGFRPFFLASGFWAAAGLALWLAQLEGWIVLPTAFDPVTWHIHEMLFGFIFAAVAGFLLTAVPNWTGHLPLQGRPLIGLVILWAAGRIAVGASAAIGPGIAALIDLALPGALLTVIAREIVSGRNWRNLPVTGGLVMLTAANVLFHAEMLDWGDTAAVGWRLGIGAIVFMICLIGGRIVPSFTRNWLNKRGETRLPAPFAAFDKISLALVIVWALLWTVVPESSVTAGAAGLAAAWHLVRLIRWRGHLTGAESLVWILHLGYLWVPVGLALLAASAFTDAIPANAGIHALTGGAMASMILAVVTRATLGHTGRGLTASRATTAIYLLGLAAGALRVLAALVPVYYQPLLSAAGLAWIGAFALFLAVYGPILCRPRADGKSG